jgi:hypothetical protein
MHAAKRFLLALFLAAPVLAVAPGCGSDQEAVAATPDQLQEAQKQRAASLNGETGGGAAPAKARFRNR